MTLQTLAGPADGAGDVQFSADGRYLVATDELQKISRWYVQAANDVIADPFNAACNLVPEGPTQDEWRADAELSAYP